MNKAPVSVLYVIKLEPGNVVVLHEVERLIHNLPAGLDVSDIDEEDRPLV